MEDDNILMTIVTYPRGRRVPEGHQLIEWCLGLELFIAEDSEK